jgi:xanthine dehydrogenase iron-sulfur cluster and FAD-binding subunit A
LLARRPIRVAIVAGCTDVGLWVTAHAQQVLDVTQWKNCAASSTTSTTSRYAAATLTEAYEALVAERPCSRPSPTFAGLPVRNSGTLGGNVANGSPIGDSCRSGRYVVLMSQRGYRDLPLETSTPATETVWRPTRWWRGSGAAAHARGNSSALTRSQAL